MSVDLGVIATTVNQAANVILVNPKKNKGITPQPTVNPNGGTTTAQPDQPQSFLFHVPGEDNIRLQSDITDNAVEDNTSLQDQIALKPITINTAGYIGELNNVTPPELELLKLAADRLTTLGPFVPVISASATRAYNAASQAYAAAVLAKNTAVSAWNSIVGGDAAQTQTKQQVAFNQFLGYYNARQLFTVQTPWAIFENMAILTLAATQDEDTRMVTHFEITFKQLTFAKSIVSTTIGQGRANAQLGKLIDKGFQKPVPGPTLGAKLATTKLGAA